MDDYVNMYGKNVIVRILMDRDGEDKHDAQLRVKLCQEEVNAMLDSDCGLLDAHQVIEDHFGLEPDYLIGFLEAVVRREKGR